ncbi:MAG: NFACT RNA binding domain-containing protein [Oligoflexus sp.]
MQESISIKNKPWKVIKCWQSPDYEFIIQASFAGIPASQAPAKKFHIILDAKQNSFGVRIQVEKPEFKPLTNPLINLWRKYCRSVLILDVTQEEKSGNIFFQLHNTSEQEAQSWHLLLSKSRPPEISLLDPQKDTLVRHGMKGTFTKRRSFEEELPEFAAYGSASLYKQKILEEFLQAIDYQTDPNPDLADDKLLDDEEDDGEDHTFSVEQRGILSRLKRRLKTVRKAYLKQQDQIPELEEVKQAELKARMLQSYAYLYREGDFELRLAPELSGLDQELVIELDVEKGLGPNIESYFKQSKKLEKARRLGTEREQQNRRELQQLEDDIAKLSQEVLSDIDLDIYYRRYRIPRQVAQTSSKAKQLSSEVAKPFKCFLSSTGHQILVGKGPQENDELTKSAKSNDYWLHSAGATGSHVIIPAQKDIREQLPEALLKEAAILAIHYSKFKADLAGETYVARKADIKKRKGMPAGLWNVERCKTMFFRYTKAELDEVLNRLQV